MKTFFSLCIMLIFQLTVKSQCTITSDFANSYIRYNSCGDPEIDNMLSQEVIYISLVLGVKINFNYYGDEDKPNAQCICVSSSNYDAIVDFGINLLRNQLWNSTLGKNAAVGILAHEMGHALQCKEHSKLSGKHRELQADYLAGYYMGRKKDFYSVEECL